ncbi:MAG: hypothetical protein GEU86_21375, partial [Actinophytocola sp.]|nr:hypothetical protein [Actinophytocola sp.]
MVMAVGLLSLPQAAAAPEPDPGDRPTQSVGSADGLPHHVSSNETTVGDDAVRDKQRGGPPAKGNAKDTPARPVELVKPKRREATWSVDRDEPVGKPAGFDPETSREIPERGGPQRQVFENADGTTTVRRFTGRQLFEAPGGDWRRVDPTLVERPRGEGWRSRADSQQKRFSRAANARQLVSVDLADGQSFGFGVSGARDAIGSVAGDTVTYEDVRPDADLVLQATPGGVKETIVLNSPDAPPEWSFPLTL